MPGLMKLTPSRIDAFEDCPLYFKLIYLDQAGPRRPRPTPQLSLGNSVHECLYLFHNEGGAGSHGREAMATLLERGWDSQGYSSPEEESRYREEALRLCQGYFDGFAHEPVATLGNEIFLNTPLRLGDTTVQLSGKLDRLSAWPDGRLEVVDYKTSNGAPPSPLKLAYCLSALLYYTLARVTYPSYDSVVVSHIYLQSQTRVTAAYTKELGKACVARLHEAVDRITRGDLPPKPCGRCAWCEVRSLCPTDHREELDAEELF